MQKLLKKLLALIYGEEPEAAPPAVKSRSSATGHLFAKDSPAARKSDPAGNQTAQRSPAQAAPKAKPNPDFDPYNTGKFDRGASWEKISKSQR